MPFNLQNMDFTELDFEQDSEQDSEQDFNRSKEDRPSMDSMMDEMQKSLAARRRAKNESGEVLQMAMAKEIEHLSLDGTLLHNCPTISYVFASIILF